MEAARPTHCVTTLWWGRREIRSFLRICNCCRKKTPDVLVAAQGSYHCGSCKSGFTGDQVRGCKPELSCGNSLTNPCNVNAQCVLERDGSISCQVRFFFSARWQLRPRAAWVSEGFHPSSQCGIGWAGNGYLCGKDTDIDGYPDEKLKCKDANCRKVSKLQLHRERQAFLFFWNSSTATTSASPLRITACTFRTLVKRMLTGMATETPVMTMQMAMAYQTSRLVGMFQQMPARSVLEWRTDLHARDWGACPVWGRLVFDLFFMTQWIFRFLFMFSVMFWVYSTKILHGPKKNKTAMISEK